MISIQIKRKTAFSGDEPYPITTTGAKMASVRISMITRLHVTLELVRMFLVLLLLVVFAGFGHCLFNQFLYSYTSK